MLFNVQAHCFKNVTICTYTPRLKRLTKKKKKEEDSNTANHKNNNNNSESNKYIYTKRFGLYFMPLLHTMLKKE